MVGKLIPDFFPKIFGPQQNQPLDADAVRARFRRRSRAESRRRPRRREEIADGFIKIAVENMANAIKKISVQRGYDVTRYALNCFGGAGGQHACLVADALGMTTRADPSVLVAAVGLRHGPRRHPRHARSRRSRCRSAPRRSPRIKRDRRRGSASDAKNEVAGQGVAGGQDQGDRARAYPLRRHRHGAGGRAPARCAAMTARLREGAQGALRLHRPHQGDGGRGGVGRGGRRRRQVQRTRRQAHARPDCRRRRAHDVSSRAAHGTTPTSITREQLQARRTRSRAPPSSSSRTRPSWSSPAGRPRSRRRTTSC